VTAERSADALIDEAARAAFQGWDFTWLAGRSDDPKTPWRYRALATDALARSTRALDIDTGGGEVLAGLAPFAGARRRDRGIRAEHPGRRRETPARRYPVGRDHVRAG
jgi:hypothetical protein